MTLDANYICDEPIDLYAAALEVQVLLNNTYGMGSVVRPITNIEMGNGYQVLGKK
jgi:hypothetical protein